MEKKVTEAKKLKGSGTTKKGNTEKGGTPGTTSPKPKNFYHKADWTKFHLRLAFYFSLFTTVHALCGFRGPTTKYFSDGIEAERGNLPEEYPEWIQRRVHGTGSSKARTESERWNEADDRELVFREGLRYAARTSIPRGNPKGKARVNRAKNHSPN